MARLFPNAFLTEFGYLRLMGTKKYNSKAWTGEIAPTGFVPSDPIRTALLGSSRPLSRQLNPAQSKAVAYSSLLIFSALSFWVASWVTGATTPDLLIAAPSLMLCAILSVALGALLWRLALWNIVPKWLSRIAIAGTATTVAAAFGYIGLYGYAHASVIGGRPLRVQIVGIQSHRSRAVTTTLALQDGSVAVTDDYSAGYGSNGQCLLVRPMFGRAGFVWLRVLDASPLPDRGQLAWPIEQKDCFSTADLSSLK